MSISSFASSYTQSVNPFTGSDDTDTVEDLIESDIDIDTEVETQLKLLAENLDLINTYKEKEKKLSYLEDLTLQLAIESLANKIEIINTGILGGLDIRLAENHKQIFTKYHGKLTDLISYMSAYYINTLTAVQLNNEATVSTFAKSYGKIKKEIKLINDLQQKVLQLSKKEEKENQIITKPMYELFSDLSKLGFDVSIEENKLKMQYKHDKEEMSLNDMGYKNMNYVRDHYKTLLSTYTAFDYKHISDMREDNIEVFKSGLESFSEGLNNHHMCIGDSQYIEKFTSMVIHKKRMIVLTDIMNANLGHLISHIEQFISILSSLKQDQTTLDHLSQGVVG